MKSSRGKRLQLPQRALSATADMVSLVTGQAFYLVGEALGWLTGNAALRQEMRAVRNSARHYWRARSLRRQGRLEDAFGAAKKAFAALRTADRRETFLQMGGMAVMLLNRLAHEAGIPGGARTELEEALEVFRAMKAEPDGSSRALDDLVGWLEQRVKQESDRA